jgi:hypothetical protein
VVHLRGGAPSRCDPGLNHLGKKSVAIEHLLWLHVSFSLAVRQKLLKLILGNLGTQTVVTYLSLIEFVVFSYTTTPALRDMEVLMAFSTTCSKGIISAAPQAPTTAAR